MQPSSASDDPYVARRDEVRGRLEACQRSRFPDAQTPSCMRCPDLIGCPLRTEYVTTVYESMNKGQTGGFEF